MNNVLSLFSSMFSSFSLRLVQCTPRVGSNVFVVVVVPDDLGNGGDGEQRKDSVGFVAAGRAGSD